MSLTDLAPLLESPFLQSIAVWPLALQFMHVTFLQSRILCDGLLQ